MEAKLITLTVRVESKVHRRTKRIFNVVILTKEVFNSRVRSIYTMRYRYQTQYCLKFLLLKIRRLLYAHRIINENFIVTRYDRPNHLYDYYAASLKPPRFATF